MMKNNYLALARKYRPQTLSQIVGHEILVKTLTNAIEQDKIHHAFLLTGTRGIGKTTTARIIALSLNCTGNNASKPVVEPCLKCTNCLQIINANHPDVIEFDAASKTGVDSMREIIDSCIYPPLHARYKIYIIDEVHMLSKAAFNALLKTLEEPPSRVKFIFATTEIKKIPITIVSRCQKYVLKNMSVQHLAQNLESICHKEGVEYEKAAIQEIASIANGSVRDSLSILDQIILSNGTVNANAIQDSISIPEKNSVLNLIDLILEQNAKEAIEKVNEILNLSDDILYIFGYILSIITDIQKSLFIEQYSVSEPIKMIVNKHQQKISVANLTRMWQIVAKDIEIVKNVDSKIALEMLSLKLIYTQNLPTLSEIIKSAN